MTAQENSPTAPLPPPAQDTGFILRLAATVDALRPVDGDPATAAGRIADLAARLEARPDLRAPLREALLALFDSRRSVLLFATAGIYPATGVIVETFRRIAHKLLPEADDPAQSKEALGCIFRRSDADWLAAVPATAWKALIDALHFAETDDAQGLDRLAEDLLEALRVVAHRVAASGLEPEMLRLDPTLEMHESPFLAQCEEALGLARRIETARRERQALEDDEQHLLVLLDQCDEAIERVRRRAQHLGASFHLTFRLRRLAQHLERARTLAGLAAALARGERDAAGERCAGLWQELSVAECRRNDLRRFWRQNAELVALRVTENAGRTGEHYISASRGEYLAMLRSALGGGLIIALMAANKLFLATLGLAPLTEVLAFCLNYALGFVLIHTLHCTVATKQPAMTANAIAAAIGEAQQPERGSRSREARDLAPLAELIARTVRTQMAAIAGNLGLAIPTAMLFALLIRLLAGEHFIPPEKALHLLHDTHPLAGGALVFAAIAGVCLFLAGLIAGYYDNLCAYNRIPDRLLQLRWPARLLGEARWRRVAAYVENNLGALAGNFFFGFLLGGVTGIGTLIGLPLDIRHIAFSSAYWGYAMVGLEFDLAWSLAVFAALGVLGIGLVNLLVSFSLALWVGLKARGVSFEQRRALASALLLRLWRQPRDFILPPRAAPSHGE